LLTARKYHKINRINYVTRNEVYLSYERSREGKISSVRFKKKQTIEQFGRDKCLEAYEKSSKHIPLKPRQKYQTWQEQVASELNVSESEAMNMWAAGNSIIQEKQCAESEGVIEKFGEAKLKEICASISEIITSNSDWQKSISEMYDIKESDVLEIFLAGTSISMKESAPNFTKTVEQYHNSRHKLHSCTKQECDGKLHVTTSLSKEFDGLYICDTCSTTFRKK
jgi:hypothetical protein